MAGGRRKPWQHLHEVSVAAFNEKYKLFIESDAQKTLTEMNKLKTFLTTDLGAAIVKAVNQFLWLCRRRGCGRRGHQGDWSPSC